MELQDKYEKVFVCGCEELVECSRVGFLKYICK